MGLHPRARGCCALSPITSWLDSDEFDARLSTVESIYRDRGARYPSKPWLTIRTGGKYSVDWERDVGRGVLIYLSRPDVNDAAASTACY